MGKIKEMIKTWLDIRPSTPQNLVVYENKDFRTMCAINRVWLRGDPFELSSLHRQLEGYENTFWGSISTAGMEIKKSHSGLPSIIVNKLSDIVINDYNGIETDDTQIIDYWESISKDENNNDLFDDLLEEVITDSLAIGDGAVRYLYDPILKRINLEWMSSENVDFKYKNKKLYEIDFNFYYEKDKKIYHLIEKRGYGYIQYELYDNDELVPLNTIEQLKELKNITFNNTVMLAVPCMINKSKRYLGRGSSIFETKYDSLDSFDEVISQWIEAVRQGRAMKYIPESLCPRDFNTGETLLPNPYDNQYMMTDDNLTETNTSNKIVVEQAQIPTENYLQSYITYLDLCLQGIISPATLGIDNKKITDANASYERQMEKTTMYTRGKIIKALNAFIPKVVTVAYQFQFILNNKNIPDIPEIKVKFGEYNSPSFDAQIETMAKARTSNIVSVETMVDELYGDSKTEKWKQEEVERIKNELGIVRTEEPSVNLDGFNLHDNEDEEINEE